MDKRIREAFETMLEANQGVFDQLLRTDPLIAENLRLDYEEWISVATDIFEETGDFSLTVIVERIPENLWSDVVRSFGKKSN